MLHGLEKFWLRRTRAFVEAHAILVKSLITTTTTLIATILIIFIFNILLAVSIGVQNSIDNIRDKISIEVDLQDYPDQILLNDLQRDLQNIGQVTIKINSKKDNLNKFLTQYSYLTDFLKSADVNPLSATIFIQASNLARYDQILSTLEDIRYNSILILKAKSFYQEQKLTIQKIVNIVESISNFLQIIALIFLTIFSLLLFNAQLIFLRNFNSEIKIKKLIGAAYDFIREPFLHSGLMIAISSTVISFYGFWFTINLMSKNSLIFSPTIIAIHQQIITFFNQNFILILIIEMIIFSIITLIISYIATSIFLKQKQL